MKLTVLILLISISPFFCLAQEFDNSKYYRLYKDGEKILRPIVFVLNDCANDMGNTNNSNIIFSIENQTFKHLSSVHHKDTISNIEFEKISLTKAKELNHLENQEYLKEAKKVLKEKGFKPVPPINHSILKVIVISKKKDNIIRYETNWVYSKL